MKHSVDTPVSDSKGEKVRDPQSSIENWSQGGTEEGAAASVKSSGQAYDMSSIREAVENAPDMREEKIATLKRMIASGEYKVNSREVADRMIKEFLLDDARKR